MKEKNFDMKTIEEKLKDLIDADSDYGFYLKKQNEVILETFKEKFSVFLGFLKSKSRDVRIECAIEDSKTGKYYLQPFIGMGYVVRVMEGEKCIGLLILKNVNGQFELTYRGRIPGYKPEEESIIPRIYGYGEDEDYMPENGSGVFLRLNDGVRIDKHLIPFP